MPSRRAARGSRQARLPRRRRRQNAGGFVPPAPLSQGVTAKPFSCSRTINVGALSYSAADKGWSFNTALTDLPTSADFTNLFQSYRFKAVTYRFTLASPSTTTNAIPIIYASEAAAGAGGPTSLSDLLQMRYRSHVLTTERPRFSYTIRWPTATFDVGAAVAAGVERGAWIATSAGSGTTYLGLSAWIVNANTTTAPSIILEEVVHLECAGLR